MTPETTQAPEEQVQEEAGATAEEAMQAELGGYLAAFPGAPTNEEIEGLKQTHGEVLCSGFSDTELFVWRPITRREFITLQAALGQQEGATQFDLEEQMVRLCLLWASPAGEKALDTKAGSLPTLHEQIMQNSNFMNPAMASALVIKL